METSSNKSLHLLKVGGVAAGSGIRSSGVGHTGGKQEKLSIKGLLVPGIVIPYRTKLEPLASRTTFSGGWPPHRKTFKRLTRSR